MCANGRWFPNAYVHPGRDAAVRMPGRSLALAEAKIGLAACVQALAADPTCSAEYVGVAENNGHCWCVDAGDPCAETFEHSYQFRHAGMRRPTGPFGQRQGIAVLLPEDVVGPKEGGADALRNEEDVPESVEKAAEAAEAAEGAEAAEAAEAAEGAEAAASARPLPPRQRVNLALAGVARQSTTRGAYRAALANDGATTGFLRAPAGGPPSAARTLTERDPWWEVQLGRESTVYSAQVHLARGLCEAFWEEARCAGGALCSEACTRGGGDGLGGGRGASAVWPHAPLLVSVFDGNGVQTARCHPRGGSGAGGSADGDGLGAGSGGVNSSVSGGAADVLTCTLGEGGGGSGVRASRVRLSAQSGEGGLLALRELAVAEVLLEGEAAPADAAQGGCSGPCVHGACTSGRCLCEPDFVGADCSVNLRAAWRYLPFEATPSHNWLEQPLAARLRRDLRRAQAPADCGAGGAFTQEVWEQAGFGSNLMFLSGLLGASLAQPPAERRAFVPGAMNFMPLPSLCGAERRLDRCIFQPWTRCDGARAERIARANDIEAWAAVPAPYTRKGAFWQRAQLLGFAFRLSDVMERVVRLERLKREIGYEHPVVGVHIRHGDACHGATTKRVGHCVPFGRYAAEAARMGRLYGIGRAFIATDDPAVIDEARAHNARLDAAEAEAVKGAMRFLFVTGANRGQLADGAEERDIEDKLADGSMDKEQMVRDTLADILLLAESDAFVGHLQSHLSRIAFALSAQQKQGIPPFASMDGAWCPFPTMCCDVDPFAGDSTPC
eukprot:g1759.t1